MDQEKVLNIAKEYAAAVRKVVDTTAIFLYGSYAKGTAQPASDVDLWVDSGLRGLSFFGLLEDVCRCVQCEVDLIDRADVIPGSAVDREIHNTGVVIYEQ